MDLSVYSDELAMTIGEALLTPTKIYVKPVLSLLEKVAVKGISHITGGGFYENIPRALPEGCSVRIERAALFRASCFYFNAKTRKCSGA